MYSTKDESHNTYDHCDIHLYIFTQVYIIPIGDWIPTDFAVSHKQQLYYISYSVWTSHKFTAPVHLQSISYTILTVECTSHYGPIRKWAWLYYTILHNIYVYVFFDREAQLITLVHSFVVLSMGKMQRMYNVHMACYIKTSWQTFFLSV